MHKYALVVVAGVLAFAGLVSLEASELLHRVAFDNAANRVAQLPADNTWQKELAKNWHTSVVGIFHPLSLMLFLIPVAALAAWRDSRWVAWVIFFCIVALFAFDMYVFLQSIEHPNNDRKGCEVCSGVFLLRMLVAVPSVVLAIIGGMKWISRRVDRSGT